MNKKEIYYIYFIAKRASQGKADLKKAVSLILKKAESSSYLQG